MTFVNLSGVNRFLWHLLTMLPCFVTVCDSNLLSHIVVVIHFCHVCCTIDNLLFIIIAFMYYSTFAS